MDPDRVTAEISDAERARYKTLGEFRRQFGPSLANAFAGLILGVLAIGGGTYALFMAIKAAADAHGNLPWEAKGRWCWLGVGGCSLVGIFGIATGLFLIYFGRFIFQQRVCVCAGGLWHFDGKQFQAFPWAEIQSIQEDTMHEHLPISSPIKYVLPTKASHSYVIKRQDGKQWYLSKNEINNLDGLIDLVRGEAQQRNIPFISS
jgi:hypothetical protein